MPDYKEMYLHLFREMTRAILILQKAQEQTEEMYIAEDSVNNDSTAEVTDRDIS